MTFEVIKLADLLSFSNGKISPARGSQERYEVFGANGLIGYTSAKNSEANTIVIGRVGSYCGSVHFAAKECWITDNAIKANVINDTDPYFAYYLLLFLNLNRFRAGSGQPLINQAILNSISVPNFAPNIQKNIATILKVLDLRIDLLKETNNTLEAIAQAIFKSWFVDFDPVHAKQQGVECAGIDKATADLFPSSFVQSELGLIPEGWTVTTFGDLLTHTIGGDWGSDEATDDLNEKVAVIRGTDIPDIRSSSYSRVPIRYTSQKKLMSRKLCEGDIVIEVSGGSPTQSTGRSLYISKNITNYFTHAVVPASFCRLFRPIDHNIGLLLSQHLSYIYSIGKMWEYQNQSTGIANFQTEFFLKNELIALPPKNLLKRYSDLIDLVIHKTQVNQIEILGKLRDILLPRLMSGKLNLSEIEEQLEGVA
jgi:type I restriction enzyme S subunit